MPRIAIVKKDRCSPHSCGGYLCAKVCPVNMEGKDCIVPSPEKKALIDEILCTGCGICPKRCPFDAIDIINLPEALENPINRYGRNGFHLYKMPAPLFHKVVGIVGRNGIGKSTAIKILAGVLKPNLGSDEEVEWEEIVKNFKGREAQTFFEKIGSGDITVAYKPQHVEIIPKSTKGTVQDLLKKVDETGKFSEVVKNLELENVLDHDISSVSGGELQRITIAATVLRKANLYIFDEPTSYLDIKQRIRVSKFIQSLVNDNTAVLLVEHDLIILDYMTDLLHIMYGKGGSYGIVSLPKTTRVGMNTYLSGFIRDENMRFRDKKIEFSPRPPAQEKIPEALTSWSNVKKKLGSFELDAESGSLGKGEIVGVVGENGIGKTTFIKILAGELKPDDGEVDVNIKVSYKPQYLDTESDEIVSAFLGNAIHKYDVQLVQPLELKHLLTKPINTLSGGELQRVMIAKCLSQDADLFLLDEPSAYLDIEQRLAFSRMIKDFAEQRNISVLIVDHDLLFLDYVSTRLIVFDGTPAIEGKVTGPFSMEEGMNKFLSGLGISMRRDPESHRPRINKLGSQLDKEQKSSGKLYY